MLQPISYYRTFSDNKKDEIRMEIAADGSYQINRRSIGGMHSSTRGTLSQAQQCQLIEVFKDWDTYETIYPNPGATAEEYYYEISYGGKFLSISDACLTLPPKMREVLRTMQKVVAGLGLL